MSDDKVREQVYKCTGCGAEDIVKLYPSERTPQVINCWKCKAGRKMELPTMLSSGTGMFPIEQFKAAVNVMGGVQND